MFESGLDLKAFVTIGAEPWYTDAIRVPTSTVAWVVGTNAYGPLLGKIVITPTPCLPTWRNTPRVFVTSDAEL